MGYAEEGFYYYTAANSQNVNYHELVYYPTEQEMRAYLVREFPGTYGDAIATCPLETLLEGTSFHQDSRMGTSGSEVYCKIFHQDLRELYRILDWTKPVDDEGDRIWLSKYLAAARNQEDIAAVIELYNEAQDNYW